MQECLWRKLVGKAPYRGSGRRGGGHFRGGGRGNFGQHLSKPDGSGSHFRGRGRGRGGGRKSQQRNSSSHPEIAATEDELASALEHGYMPPVEEGDSQHSASIPTSTMTVGQAPVALVTPKGKAASTRRQPQIAWCELCRVDCNSLQILEQHKNGKKHKKNLQRLEESQKVKNPIATPIPMAVPLHTSMPVGAIPATGPISAPLPVSVSLETPVPEVQNQFEPQSESNSEVIMQSENIEGGKANISVAPENMPTEVDNYENKVEGEEQNDLAEKPEAANAEPVQASARKRRFDRLDARRHGVKRNTRGGRGGKRLRSLERQSKVVEPPKEQLPIICDLCNVKCDTQAVFDSHLAGKKHLSKLKRFHGHQAVYGSLGLQALYPPNPNAPPIFIPPVHQQAYLGPFPPVSSTAQHPVTGSEFPAKQSNETQAQFPLNESQKSFMPNPNDQQAAAAVEQEGNAVLLHTVEPKGQEAASDQSVDHSALPTIENATIASKS